MSYYVSTEHLDYFCLDNLRVGRSLWLSSPSSVVRVQSSRCEGVCPVVLSVVTQAGVQGLPVPDSHGRVPRVICSYKINTNIIQDYNTCFHIPTDRL